MSTNPTRMQHTPKSQLAPILSPYSKRPNTPCRAKQGQHENWGALIVPEVKHTDQWAARDPSRSVHSCVAKPILQAPRPALERNPVWSRACIRRQHALDAPRHTALSVLPSRPPMPPLPSLAPPSPGPPTVAMMFAALLYTVDRRDACRCSEARYRPMPAPLHCGVRAGRA